MSRAIWNAARLLVLGGLVLQGGCFARALGNLDLLLGSNAIENAARLPFSAVAPLAEFLLRLGPG